MEAKGVARKIHTIRAPFKDGNYYDIHGYKILETIGGKSYPFLIQLPHEALERFPSQTPGNHALVCYRSGEIVGKFSPNDPHKTRTDFEYLRTCAVRVLNATIHRYGVDRVRMVLDCLPEVN